MAQNLGATVVESAGTTTSEWRAADGGTGPEVAPTPIERDVPARLWGVRRAPQSACTWQAPEAGVLPRPTLPSRVRALPRHGWQEAPKGRRCDALARAWPLPGAACMLAPVEEERAR